MLKLAPDIAKTRNAPSSDDGEYVAPLVPLPRPSVSLPSHEVKDDEEPKIATTKLDDSPTQPLRSNKRPQVHITKREVEVVRVITPGVATEALFCCIVFVCFSVCFFQYVRDPDVGLVGAWKQLFFGRQIEHGNWSNIYPYESDEEQIVGNVQPVQDPHKLKLDPKLLRSFQAHLRPCYHKCVCQHHLAEQPMPLQQICATNESVMANPVAVGYRLDSKQQIKSTIQLEWYDMIHRVHMTGIFHGETARCLQKAMLQMKIKINDEW